MTLDPDVAERLARLARDRRTSFKETLNAVLRRGLSGQADGAGDAPFVVTPHAAGWHPGLGAKIAEGVATALRALLDGGEIPYRVL